MAIYIEAGWDAAISGSLAIEVVEATGPTTLNVSLTSAKWCHTNISSVIGGSNYTALAGVLEFALEAASVGGGNSWGYTVTWNRAAGTYTILSPNGNIALDFTTAAELRMAQTLGFSSGAHGSAASHASDKRPFYYILGAMGAASQKSDDYEPRGVVEGAEADDGSHFAIARTAAPTYNDFSLLFESKAATYSRSATAAVPWTFQHFWQHARGDQPFLVYDGTDSTVHYLRPDSGSFAPDRAVDDWDNAWHLRFGTYAEGRL